MYYLGMKKVVLTGEFLNGVKELKRVLYSAGYETVKNLDTDVSYLIVGDANKSYWATSRTGILIHEVTRLELKGQKIDVLYESELEDKLRNLNQHSTQL